MPQPREKIKPVLDVPLLLQMETVAGLESPSPYSGLEYRYDVMHERRPATIYLPAEGREAIVRAQPQPGDYVELLKQKRGGQHTFRAQVVADSSAGPPPPAPQGQQSLPLPGVARPPAAADGAERPVRRLAEGTVGVLAAHTPATFNGQTLHGLLEPPAAAGPALPAPVHPLRERLVDCLRCSFDAWEELRAYALQRGVDLPYTTADVRATANTFYLEALRTAR